jgi:tetratricopeptide (TPR) repeat protein
MMAILAPLLFDVMKHQREFDERFYTFLLRKLKDKKPGKIGNALEKEFSRYSNEDKDEEHPVKPPRLDPKIEITIDQALEMAENGHVKAAEKIIMKLLRKHPEIHFVQFAAGVIFLMKQRYPEAISHFDRAIAINPCLVEAWYNKGAAHQNLLNIEQTIMAYKKVVEIGDSTESFVIRAKSFIDKFEKSLRKDGLNITDYLKGGEKFEKAFAAMEKGQWEEALGGFKEVLSLNPKHTQSYGNMGICYGFLGQKEEALAAFDKALDIDAGYEPAQINRALTLSLKEGEKLNIKVRSVKYYLERKLGNRDNMTPDTQ